MTIEKDINKDRKKVMTNSSQLSDPVVRCGTCDLDVLERCARKIEHIIDSRDSRMEWICNTCENWIREFNSHIYE